MIAENLQIVKERIKSAALQCGRKPTDIRLVAVSKTYPISAIQEAMAADQFLFGENYIQEAEKKCPALDAKVQFHFIGHLQSNKAGIAARIFGMIETVDRVKLALNLNKHLVQSGRTMDILIQVNIGKDDKKSGIPPEDTEGLIHGISSLSNLRIRGLMTMPPFFDDPERVRPCFRQLRLLAEDLRCKGLFYDNDTVELSMGMSNDFPIAIEEGATLVRIGTAIFGTRPLPT